MHVVVLGAGVVGTTSAYYLRRRGHEVTVVERRPAAGLETSFANGGLVTPGMSAPWSAPGVPGKLLRWLGREDAPLLLRLSAVPGMLGWGLAFLRHCAPQRWRADAAAVLRLAQFSQAALTALPGELGEAVPGGFPLAYDRAETGILRLGRDAHGEEQLAEDAALAEELGIPHRRLAPDECLVLEPSLAPIAEGLRGGLLFPEDQSGDCHAFTQALAEACRRLGVRFLYDTPITALETSGGTVRRVLTPVGPVVGDRYVLALGSFSPLLTRPLGFDLPVRPVKGYSATVALDGWNGAPRHVVTDYGRHIGVARLGDRLRIAGTAEFSGYDAADLPGRYAMLDDGLYSLFPDFPRGAEITHWSGLRPMTPDGRPLIGPTAIANLFLNTGHGSLGWTLACGSARLVAALVAGEAPEIDPAPFAPARRI